MALDFSQLSQFTGTENWYRHNLMRNILYTDGVKYVAEEAGAYWLIDIIASMQLEAQIKAEEFQAWKLEVKSSSAELTMDEGNGNIVYNQHIDFTTFPEPGITLWFTDNVIMLPSEY